MKMSRRTMLGCGLATWAGLSLPAFAQGQQIRIPPGPMRLSRRLVRELSEKDAIVVTREWSVRFAKTAGGYAVFGEQVSVDVEAPEALAPLVAIEERRDMSDMFPISLSVHGELFPEEVVGGPASEGELSEAVRTAEKIIGDAGGQGANHHQHLAALAAAGTSMLETMPRDLFFPKQTDWHDKRVLTLPGGQKGEIELNYRAESAENGGWLVMADRDVTTRLGDMTRKSCEIWRLSEI